MTQPQWVADFPTGWEISNNSGTSWAPAPASTAQVVGPTGTQRYRVQFTIPDGWLGFWTATFAGDIHANLGPAQVYYDGVLQGAVDNPGLFGPETFTLPLIPGAHTLELWIGNANSGAGLTVPQVDLDAPSGSVPCDCCPVAAPHRCAVVQVPFNNVTQIVAQTGWTPSNLHLTIDGITATPATSGYNSPAGVGPSTTLRVEYSLAVAHSRVRGVRIWGQGGSDLNDADGPASWVTEFYAGAVLLATLPSTGANGAAPVTSLLPGGQELTGVTRVVMRDILKLSGSTVSPLWREFQLLEVQEVYPCRRRSGALQWYSQAGVLVPAADLVECG
jgi:hypothetical protein